MGAFAGEELTAAAVVVARNAAERRGAEENVCRYELPGAYELPDCPEADLPPSPCLGLCRTVDDVISNMISVLWCCSHQL